MEAHQDKWTILVLSIVFLVGFFVLFIGFPHLTNSPLFQYLFFIASLTMAFTGFFGATGTFQTKGQTLGGGAAIFVVMVVALISIKTAFSDDNSINQIKKLAQEENPETLEAAVKSIRNELEELRKRSQRENLSLVLKQGIKNYTGKAFVTIESNSDQQPSVIDPKGRSMYEIPLKNLGERGSLISIKPDGNTKELVFEELIFTYDPGGPRIELVMPRGKR